MDEQQVEDIVKCSDCGSRSLTRDETRGEVVCDDCGLVLEGIVSGYHMDIKDWCVCPNTNMPALYSKYIAWLKKDPHDPITGKMVDISAVQLLKNPCVHVKPSPD